MSREVKKFLIVLVILSIFAGVTYYNFAKYAPKSLRRVDEVKGYKSPDQEKFINLPYPPYSVKMGSNQIGDATQTTIETEQTPEQVHNFYKNILLDQDWEVESEGVHENFQVCKFKKDDKLITVISSKQTGSNTTIASIEVSAR